MLNSAINNNDNDLKKLVTIEHINGSAIPFCIKDSTIEDALEKVYKHMGSQTYFVTKIEDYT